jgi:hypothetical protein
VTAAPTPNFDHLLHMTDEHGTFEHALLSEPRPEHGYCTDDMARVLVVATREPHPTPAVRRLAERSLRFLSDAQGFDGDYRNRLNPRGRWDDGLAVADSWGRSVWGLGTAAAHSEVDWVRQAAAAQFERAVLRRSPAPRAMAFAAVGAAEMLGESPEHRGARDLLRAAADGMALAESDTAWPWPEARLTYGNAVLPEAMIAAGHGLGRDELLAGGLSLLGWLLEHETSGGHLSVTPAGGSGPDDRRPAFDQQPIEVAALADACARAAVVDGDAKWVEGIGMAVAWFLGDNDGGRVMWDPETGGGFDGLEVGGCNLNEGTESTLALLSTLQHARRLTPVDAAAPR